MQQDVIPVVMIIRMNKQTNQIEIKFLLEGIHLSSDNGDYFLKFLEQAIDEFKPKLEDAKS